ncbi:bifunctional DNA-formamidopyrimidine glycosylase/DNA-(apurinic or apyrimidinic site) lyase [Aliiglaciecola sp. 3_MG-2023]|uniref:bifunctional DNA-formamidopyrimidine glycosylase/DNA-(apurinic or apyrimidinic site) lyase n=1 Tax=Aliiglaciecola sp. 3_MG-2023 TaxID=3062644 RepID=UPI0026E3B033|nr:bifunctional DNA-formamidopyrimidine glycosylase/DNA-(apurinic or apyrimidinic site) lyase [Aliiglaciecola sp. 3_MG-2023]MDO6693007.1 bifunctional DNA-formamidopyrimidine glycosylase/DNA-(apurinic or apyrimidinic site) lyase [Aliiglaciecola sp. 3_MG-2023]
MPELPEVEVSRLGISPHMIGKTISQVVVRHKQLRWPIPDEVHLTHGLVIETIRRRAKYLLIDTLAGSIILHLGMSGRLRVVPINTPLQKHDHVDIQLTDGLCLRLNDARRFGACLWLDKSDESHSLFRNLGPEPLTDDFDAQRLVDMSRGKLVPVKSFIMDNKVVVGVGNIYANESLFLAGIDPRRQAGKVSKKRYLALTPIIKDVLTKAIEQGGTTLKDFAQADGSPGYFAQELRVYGRAKQPCVACESPIKSVVIGQRNTFYCPTCQR